MRIQIKRAGFRELRTSAAAEAALDEASEAMAGRANAVPSTTDPAATEPYYEVADTSDSDRARRQVRTAAGNFRAMRHEAKTQALQRSL